MHSTIDIDAELFRQIEELARRNGQSLSMLVEQALRNSLRTSGQDALTELYGEPLTDEEIGESARITFQVLDKEESAQTR